MAVRCEVAVSIRLELRIGEIVHRAAPPDVMEAFQQAEVRESAGGQSGFQLSFWAGKRSRVSEAMVARLFDPPTRVILSVVVRGRRHVLVDGVVTRHDYAPSNKAGQTLLTLSGTDLTFYMDLVDATGRSFPAAPPFTQVVMMLAPYASLGILGRVVPNVIQLLTNPVEKIPLQRGTDLAHIRSLAAQAGYVFYVEPGPTAGRSAAYWGPEVRLGPVQPALSVDSDGGSNVESLSFSFDGLARRVVTSDWFDETRKRMVPLVVPDVSVLKPPLGRDLPPALKHVNEALDVPEPPDLARPALTDAERRTIMELYERDVAELRCRHNASLAETLAYRLAYTGIGSDAVSASGQVDVLRYGHVLRSRRLVGVRGGGARYDGTWFVTGVSHTLRPGTFTQSFQLARGAFGSVEGTVTR
jgi:hypothetical protein